MMSIGFATFVTGVALAVSARRARRGDTSLVFALTRGDTSAKAVKAFTHEIHSR